MVGAERFDARSKKEWEAHKYSKLGAKVSSPALRHDLTDTRAQIVHKVKMPIAMLQGVKKKRKRRAIEAAAEVRAIAVVFSLALTQPAGQGIRRRHRKEIQAAAGSKFQE